MADATLADLLGKHLDLMRLSRLGALDLDDSEWDRLIEAAPNQVRQLLHTEGHFNALVEVLRVPASAGAAPRAGARPPGEASPAGAQVVVRVSPGPRAKVAQLQLAFEGELDSRALAADAAAVALRDGLRRTWPLAEERPFSNRAWAEAKAVVLTRLRTQGYANATLTHTAADVDAATNTVRLTVRASSGPLFRLGGLEIEGLQQHSAQTVRAYLNEDAGTPLTETVLLDFQDRLQKSGLFTSVRVMLDTASPDPAAAQVSVLLSEAALQVYTLGLGYSANTGARASVEHVYRRALGQNLTARNKVEWGVKRSFWTGELSTFAGEGLSRWLIGGTVERLKSDTDTVLSQRVRAGLAQDGARFEQLIFVEAERSERRTGLAGGSASTFSVGNSLNHHAVWRDLDNVILPTQGYSLATQSGVGLAHGNASASGRFVRGHVRLTGYWPLPGGWFGQARGELGRVWAANGVVVPDSLRFRAGGDESVRGYGYRSLGPLVGSVVGSGNAVATVSLEAAHPIWPSVPSLWGAVFVDAGQAGDTLSQLDWQRGYGLGLRWRSPVGPLRLDWAYGEGLRRSRVHFSVGIAF